MVFVGPIQSHIMSVVRADLRFLTADSPPPVKYMTPELRATEKGGVFRFSQRFSMHGRSGRCSENEERTHTVALKPHCTGRGFFDKPRARPQFGRAIGTQHCETMSNDCVFRCSKAYFALRRGRRETDPFARRRL